MSKSLNSHPPGFWNILKKTMKFNKSDRVLARRFLSDCLERNCLLETFDEMPVPKSCKVWNKAWARVLYGRPS